MTGKPRYHTFWNSLIVNTLTLMSMACLSFTGTASAMDFFHAQGKIERAPSAETCIQWEMKWGLYKLLRPKATATDWIWLADHVVSKGAYKCLVVVGVRMNTLLKRKNLTLCYEDLEPLGIIPMKESNGELMRFEFEHILAECGGIPPLAIIKDRGSDLRAGGRKFSEAHPGVINLDDIPHRIARLYEHELREDSAWKEFTKVCANFKREVQLTEYANLSPPNQRAKARYHNIDVLIDWATEQMMLFGELSKDEQKKMNWLKEYQSELEHWQQLVDIGRVGRDFIRTNGLWSNCYELLEDSLLKMKINSRAERFACDLIDVVEEAGNKIPQGQKVIGSTEILESLFGKHKSIAERGPKPMGRLILTMASRIGEKPTEAVVQQAFEQIKEKDVAAWQYQTFHGRGQTLNGINMESRSLVA